MPNSSRRELKNLYERAVSESDPKKLTLLINQILATTQLNRKIVKGKSSLAERSAA